MEQIKKVILLFVILKSQYSCVNKIDPGCPKDYHEKIKVTNKSKDKIYAQIYIGDIGLQSTFTHVKAQKSIIKSDSSYSDNWGIFRRRSNTCIEASFINDKKFYFYFFDADIVEKTKWEDVQQKGIGILERRKIDLDYLIKNNFEVVYE